MYTASSSFPSVSTGPVTAPVHCIRGKGIDWGTSPAPDAGYGCEDVTLLCSALSTTSSMRVMYSPGGSVGCEGAVA